MRSCSGVNIGTRCCVEKTAFDQKKAMSAGRARKFNASKAANAGSSHVSSNHPNQPVFFILATESLSSASRWSTLSKFISVNTVMTFSLMLHIRSLTLLFLQRVEKWISFPIIADDMKLTFSKLTMILSFSSLIKSSSSSPRVVMRASSMMLTSWK